MKKTFSLIILISTVSVISIAQTNPLWTEKKVKNYLPHMTVPTEAPNMVAMILARFTSWVGHSQTIGQTTPPIHFRQDL